MALISMRGATLNLGGKPLLDEADFSLEPGERVCLTGRNGAGKSTLMGLLGGDLKADSGEIARTDALFGRMPQNVPENWRWSVFSLVAAALGQEGEALNAAIFSPPAASAC